MSLLLSAALIAKNEDKFIGECLSSLKDVADEVIVVDTGSTDRTKQIAASGGARLYEFPWNGDFSAARNHALDQCTGAWILYIDADERVRRGSTANLRAELSAASYIGYQVLLYPLRGHTSYWSLRLFKNDPSVRFRGMIHESTWPALTEYRAKQGGQLGYSRMEIDHEGYEENQEAKNVRNLPLLLRSLRQEPGRVYSWCHLANIYTAMHEDQRAEEAWRNALAVVRKRGPRTPEDILPYLGLIENEFKAGRDVSVLFAEALSLFPSSVQLEWLRGRILMRQGEVVEAISAFEKLVARGESRDFDYLAAYDLRLFGVFAYDALATCYFRLGRYAESRHYYDLAARQEPNQLEYRVKRALCSQLALRRAGSSASLDAISGHRVGAAEPGRSALTGNLDRDDG